MTIPEAPAAPSFALFASGATFSCAVFAQLRARRILPRLVVLPEYAPARDSGNLLRVETTRPFLDLAGDLELAFAPRARQQACAERLRRRSIDYVLVACWPYLIGPALRSAPRVAALNLHPSLLPRFRGPDPIDAQLGAGVRRGGVTLHLLDERFDHGRIVAQSAFEIDTDAGCRSSLEQRCARLGVGLFIDAVAAGRAAWRCRAQNARAAAD